MDLIAPGTTEEQRNQVYAEVTKLLNKRTEDITIARMELREKQNAIEQSPPTMHGFDAEELARTHIMFQPMGYATMSIPAGKIYMDRLSNRQGELEDPFGVNKQADHTPDK